MPKTSRSAKKSKPARRKVAVRKSVTRKTAPKKKAVTRKTIPKKKVASKKQLVAKKKVAAPKKPTPKVKAKAKAKTTVKARAKVTPPRTAKVVPAKPAPAAVKPTKSRLIKANVAAPGSQMPGVAQTEGATESVLQIGQLAPDFRLPANDGRVIALSEFRGRKVVLYFYPKDDTPGCTKEACSFRDGLTEIEQRGAVVLGVSVDPIDSHQMFHEKFGLNFPLLSDEWKEVVQAYGVWKERSHEGRAYMTTERTTFVIDEDGRIARIFPKVQVEGHFDEVLAAL